MRKRTSFIILFLALSAMNPVFAGETFDNQNIPVVEETQAAPAEQADEAKPQKKKFFSILEKNKDEKTSEEANAADETQKKDVTAEKPDNAGPVTNVLVDSDTIEYFPERHEFEALGHAKVFFPEENSTLTADKIIFNHDTNYIKAYDNVVIDRENEKIFGDYVHIDLNDENAVITNPVMAHMNIQIKAKHGNINDAKVEAMEGTANFQDSQMFHLVSRSVFGFEKPPLETELDKTYFVKEKYNNEWNLKSKVIIIDSYKDRDIVTLEKSDVFLKDLKVGSTGKIKIYTNKEQQYVETSIAEFGSLRNLGAFISPAYVFQLPGSSTFKVGPMLNYDDSELGFGGLGRFQSGTNRTDIGYSTARGKVVVRGRQKFTDKLWLQYGMNSYMDEWFMGGRMPEYGGQLVYSSPYYNEDLKLRFENRFTGGFFKEWGESNFSTTRFRWQTNTAKEIYNYRNSDNKFAATFGLNIQSTTSLYGTGDTYAMVRTGPYLRTQYRAWQQYLGYFIGGEAGDSPFWFDKFYYGKSSVMLGESLKINKYLSLMYSAVIALSDTPNDKMLQENRFYLVIGPDDFKVLLGYDAYRKNTTFGINMAVGTENSEVEFKKLILNEPENLGKSTGKKKTKNVADKKDQSKNEDPMNRSVKDYDGYQPGFGALNNLIQPGIRPMGY